MDDLISVKVSGEPFYIFGDMTKTTMRLVPRKWWQFWKPRYVEEWRTETYRPTPYL